MLDDLSMHMLDIAENSIAAGATSVVVTLEDAAGWRTFTVEDNGRGMDEATCAAVVSPFVTSRTTRRVGLGIPFLKQIAELCGGSLTLTSAPGVGTTLTAAMQTESIDCPPLGNIPSTVATLLAGHPEIAWEFRFLAAGEEFVVRRDDLVEALEDAELLRTPPIVRWVNEHVAEGLQEVGLGC